MGTAAPRSWKEQKISTANAGLSTSLRRAGLGLALLAALLAPAAPLGAASSLKLSGAGFEDELRSLAALLTKGGTFSQPSLQGTGRDGSGRWDSASLAEALGRLGPLNLMQAREIKEASPARELEGRGFPRLVLLENRSTIRPLSKDLPAWGLPFTVLPFAEAERNPRGVFDAVRTDAVVFSSPGWWQDFADPPSGPSRMGEAVAAALRAYVSAGGTAIFLDYSQWDALKTWPGGLQLAPLGPYALSKLRVGGARRGLASLAREGVAAERVDLPGAFTLVGSENFAYPDGQERPVHAAWACPDPGGGRGWIAGLAFHVFEQNDSLSQPLRRLFLNLLLLSGSRRLRVGGETWPQASAAEAPRPEGVPAVTATPSPTALVPPAKATLAPTARPTSPPTATALPSATPPPTATPMATATQVRTATPRATETPRPRPPQAPATPPAVLVPTLVPRPAPPLLSPSPGAQRISRPLLTCLAAEPQAFRSGGVYLRYCLERPARVRLAVLSQAGKELWNSGEMDGEAGLRQLYFNGLVGGQPLAAGPYLFSILARDRTGHSEIRFGRLRRE